MEYCEKHNILCNLERGPYCSECARTEDGQLRKPCEIMPFDRYEDGKGFIHATGYEIYNTWTGSWRPEYEDELEEEPA